MKHEQSDLRIRISQLSEGIHNYQLISHPTELELAENFQETIAVDASLEKTKRQLYLRVLVSTKAKFQCDRCADEFDFPIQTSYNICYTYDEKDSESFPDDELRTIHIGTPYLELIDDVRDCIMLAVPMKLICKEECKGLCPHCCVNMNDNDCSCAKKKHRFTLGAWAP
ncbi:MAG: DUF177 domain-containing protein [Ignavibacteriales bacterium]|nr:DUF177 domain-containing protein [Ignavibacteriales bacterium]